MFGSEILDVALGMVFMFAMLSLVASAVREGIETVMKARAKDLEKGIGELLSDTDGSGAKQWLYDHPTIAGLYRGTLSEAKTYADTVWKPGSKLPAYIPSRSFAEAILDLAARGTQIAVSTDVQAKTVANIRDGIKTHFARNACLQRSLLVALDNAGDDLDKARGNVEAWFDAGMGRVSGWYKRRTQYWLLAIGLFTALLMNVDSIRVVNALSTNDTLRKAVVAQAEAAAKAGTGGAPTTFKAAQDNVKALGLPVGWSGDLAAAIKAECARQTAALPKGAQPAAPAVCNLKTPSVFSGEGRGLWLTAVGDAAGRSLLGWLISAFAISFGAPFWFDVLNKIMVIRSTVKPGEKTGESAQKDARTK